MFNLEQSIIYIMENVATVSNAEYETRMNINYIWAVIKEFSPILSSLIALYVAWSNQRFNENQKLKDLKNGYCNKFISDYIKLRQCVEDLQYKAYELLAYADTPDEIGEKFRQFELLKEKIVIISNETMYSSGMLAKIFGGKADKEVRNKACTIGTEVGRVCSFFIDEIKKAGSYEEYIKENPEIITEKIGEICEPFKKSLTERIDDAQNKILEIE